MQNIDRQTWQIIDVGSVWMKEFASAMARQTKVTAWSPLMSKIGALRTKTRSSVIQDPPLEVHEFALQRGYAREPIGRLFPFQHKLIKLLEGACEQPAISPLICSTPFYAPVAEQWPGPVVYYSTDLTVAYHGIDPDQVRRLDKRMCAAASYVCPNSRRIAAYFTKEADCDPTKITVVPNATRAMNVSPQPLLLPGELPEAIRDCARPIAGVIGNLTGNMDWQFIAEAIRATPHVCWVFVGPSSMTIHEPSQAEARSWVQQHARFVGNKPYGELQYYARAFDVAILPYRKKEPTYSGSSTRFYEHLAACRPMIATRGFAELLEKTPLVTLVDSAAELLEAIIKLEKTGFQDGLESDRWVASHLGTWEERARVLRELVNG